MSKKQRRREEREQEAQARRNALIARQNARESGELPERPAPSASGLAPKRRGKLASTRLVVDTVEVTGAPIMDPRYPEPAEVAGQREELFDLAQDRPSEAIPRLEALLAKYPNYPTLYNWLALAYMGRSQSQKADEVIEENYRRHPDYLFARCNYADLLMRKGRPDKVPAVFGDDLSLGGIAPGRKRVHITEVTSFAPVMGKYFLMIGEPKRAVPYAKIMAQVAPDHPNTMQLISRLVMSGAMSVQELEDMVDAKRGQRR